MKKVFEKFHILTTISIVLVILFFVSCNNETGGPEEDDPDSFPEYVTQVFEYAYAPGQHARNVKPADSEKLIGKPFNDVYLGGFGGYIVAGFDHDVPNVENEPDIEIFSAGVSPEPAVVYVMCDENGDGIPNETWYELKGSEFNHPKTIRNYQITYYKPRNDSSNVSWKDNQNGQGELISTYGANSSANWWWNTEADSVVFSGTRLPNAYVNISTGETENWIVPDTLFTWGYAENNQGSDYSKESRGNKLDISNAVDADGKPVQLSHIRFVKVQTAVLQQAGWLNEVSSEIQGIKDLHY